MIAPDTSERGFTLIEVMVSLGLFALIAVAGLGLVDGVLGVQGRTEQRLDRVAAIERAMFIVASDFGQATHGAVRGGGGSVSLTRAAPGLGGPPVAVQYRIAGGALVRIAGAQPELALTGVRAGKWRFLKDGTWRDRWPPDPGAPDAADARPDAVALDLDTQGGSLRKVVDLPATLPKAPAR